MPLHPSPPDDLSGLVAAFAQTLQAIIDLGISCPERDFGLATECPGWTVKDQFAHIVSTESTLLGRPDPPVDVPDLLHVRHAFGRRMEAGVELRRARTGKEVVAELQRVAPARLARLRDPEFTESTVVDSPFGPRELGAALPVRIMDLWCHEQDIRTALERPGNLDSPAAALFVARVLDALPEIVVDKARVEAGRVVMIELTGPVMARTGVRIEKAEDGTTSGHLMFAGGGDETGPIPVIGKTTSLQMSTETFTRRAAGRRAVADLHYSVHGDEGVARRVLDELVVTP